VPDLIPPVEVTSRQTENEAFRGGEIRRDRDVIKIAETDQRALICFVLDVIQIHALKGDQKIHFLIGNGGFQLSVPAEAPCEKGRNLEAGRRFHMVRGGFGSQKMVLRQYVFICNAEIIQQVFLFIVCMKRDREHGAVLSCKHDRFQTIILSEKSLKNNEKMRPPQEKRA
jgi:hypothetical protein